MRGFVILCMLFSSVFSFGQLETGLRLGVSSTDLAEGSIYINSHDQTYKLTVLNAEYGYHLGLYARLSVANVYMEPAILFNSNRVNYRLEESIFDTGIVNTALSETYNNLDIPILIGMKLGFFRIQGGPVAHIHINSFSDLSTIEGYEANYKKATYGIQGGFGIDIMKIRLDLNYETNLRRFGDHITIGGEEFMFDERPNRLVASLSIKF